jgi:hypothetical protein
MPSPSRAAACQPASSRVSCTRTTDSWRRNSHGDASVSTTRLDGSRKRTSIETRCSACTRSPRSTCTSRISTTRRRGSDCQHFHRRFAPFAPPFAAQRAPHPLAAHVRRDLPADLGPQRRGFERLLSWRRSGDQGHACVAATPEPAVGKRPLLATSVTRRHSRRVDSSPCTRMVLQQPRFVMRVTSEQRHGRRSMARNHVLGESGHARLDPRGRFPALQPASACVGEVDRCCSCAG